MQRVTWPTVPDGAVTLVPGPASSALASTYDMSSSSNFPSALALFALQNDLAGTQPLMLWHLSPASIAPRHIATSFDYAACTAPRLGQREAVCVASDERGSRLSHIDIETGIVRPAGVSEEVMTLWEQTADGRWLANHGMAFASFDASAGRVRMFPDAACKESDEVRGASQDGDLLALVCRGPAQTSLSLFRVAPEPGAAWRGPVASAAWDASGSTAARR